MSHELSETIQGPGGLWYNVSGHTGTPLLPIRPDEQFAYDTVEQAVTAARQRSASHGAPVMANGLPIFDATDALAGPGGTLPTGAGETLPPESAPAKGDLFTGRNLMLALAGLSDALTAGLSGTPGKSLPNLLTAERGVKAEERAKRTEERAIRTEERQAATAAETSARENIRLQMSVTEAKAKATKDVMTDAVTYLEGAEGLSPEDKAVLERGLMLRMAAASPADVVTLQTMFTDRAFAKDVSELTPFMTEQQINTLQTNSRFMLRKKEGTTLLRDAAELAVERPVAISLRNRAFTVARRLRGEGKTGTLDRDELRKSLLDSGSAAELALFEGTRFREDVRKSAEDVVTGSGFGPRGVAAKAAEAAATTAATTAAAKGVELSPEVVDARARAEAKVKRAVLDVERQFEGTKPLTASEASTVRGQFLTRSTDFQSALRAYTTVQEGAKNPTPAGDIAIVYGYMQLLDPGSHVLAGEVATAENAAGVPETVRNIYNKVLTGLRLGEQGAPTRADFSNRSTALIRGQLQGHEQIERAFRDVAKRSKGDPDAIVPDLIGADLRKRIKEAPERKAPTANAPPKAATLDQGRAELKRLTDGGLSRTEALDAMKKKGWK